MGNTEDKKQAEWKKIPRNPNMPLKDEEVDALLKKAAKQISEKEKNAEVKATDAKPGTPAKRKEDPARENVNLNPSVEKPVENKKKVKTEDKKPDLPETDAKKSVQNAKSQKEFKVEDDVYVTKRPSKVDKNSDKSYKMSAGDVIGSIFEGIWTGIKLLVLVALATAIVGFFMSRDLMIRGRSGEQLSKQDMNVAAGTLSTQLEERKSGKTWNETVKKEKLTMETDDGKILVAQKVVVDKDADNWVVILHGQNGTVEDIYDLGFRYATEGYNVLMPDLRAHGESEGSFYGMGWLDRLDVINWIDVILEDAPSANIIIHGVDLGADTALMLSGEPLKDSIKGIVAEGAYTSAWDAVKKEYKARHAEWPTFPMMHMLNAVSKVWGGYSLKEADAVKQVKKTDVPILLIHGQNDTYATPEMTEELSRAIASEHEVLTIASGTHEDCRFAEPDTYYNKVFEFVGKYMK